jgi:hypothetical protein
MAADGTGIPFIALLPRAAHGFDLSREIGGLSSRLGLRLGRCLSY